MEPKQAASEIFRLLIQELRPMNVLYEEAQRLLPSHASPEEVRRVVDEGIAQYLAHRRAQIASQEGSKPLRRRLAHQRRELRRLNRRTQGQTSAQRIVALTAALTDSRRENQRLQAENDDLRARLFGYEEVVVAIDSTPLRLIPAGTAVPISVPHPATLGSVLDFLREARRLFLKT